MEVLKINKEQADIVRGIYENNYSIEPIKYHDFYILPADILTIKEYSCIFDILKNCELITITPKINEV